MTWDEAIARLIEQDVERWGEQERPASERLHRSQYPTVGLAINALAARAALAESPDATELRAAADAALTDEDWGALCQGG